LIPVAVTPRTEPTTRSERLGVALWGASRRRSSRENSAEMAPHRTVLAISTRGAARDEKFSEALAVCFRGLRVFRVAGDQRHHPLPDPDDAGVIDATVMRCAQQKSADRKRAADHIAEIRDSSPLKPRAASACWSSPTCRCGGCCQARTRLSACRLGTVAHFGSIRGQDRWRDFETVLVIGRRPAPAPRSRGACPPRSQQAPRRHPAVGLGRDHRREPAGSSTPRCWPMHWLWAGPQKIFPAAMVPAHTLGSIGRVCSWSGAAVASSRWLRRRPLSRCRAGHGRVCNDDRAIRGDP
jgi:hypothetical protein